jgi:ADP-ribose pyrophosphatase
VTEKVETLHRGKHVVLLKEGRWEYVQRVSNRGAVFVMALTPAQELVLVEQHRVPLHADSLELPAGILGDEAAHRDETPEACALRELEEETGFRGKAARQVMTGSIAPGLTSERMYLVQVSGLERVHAGGGIGQERIRVHCVPLPSAAAWLREQAAGGLVVDARVYAALYFLGQK